MFPADDITVSGLSFFSDPDDDSLRLYWTIIVYTLCSHYVFEYHPLSSKIDRWAFLSRVETQEDYFEFNIILIKSIIIQSYLSIIHASMV